MAGQPPIPTSKDAAGGPAEAVATSVEEYGDLHEYGLSLGVDLDAEGEEDLLWAVQEAFSAPLPGCWSEYADSAGRAFYVKDGSSASTWEPPTDEVYRELLGLVKRVRAEASGLAQREAVVREHLLAVHERAKAELAGWSGPYVSEQGEYYHNEVQNTSTWACPVTEWEQELAVRHAVLSRYLLPDAESVAAVDASAPRGSHPALVSPVRRPSCGEDLLRSLRLQLGNLSRERDMAAGEVPEPSTTRSYHTTRSTASSRSSRSGRHKHHKDHKERKERKEKLKQAAEDRSLLEQEEPAPTPTEFNSVD